MKVDTPYLIAGGVGLLALLGGLAFWFWGGTTPEAPTQTAADCVAKETFEVTDSDYSMGKADAPITIIEYASMTCPHCARFTRDVFPKLKESYIDTGHVRYVFREFPLDRVALTVSVVGRCLQKDAYLPFVDLMYGEFDTWTKQEDLRGSIKEMARRAGMSGDDFEKCLSTDTDAKKIVAAQEKATKDYCIAGTPLFLMNGKMVASGEIPWAELDEKVRAALKAKGVDVPAAAAAAPATPDAGAPASAATPGAATPGAATPGAATPGADGAAPAAGVTPAPATPPTPAPAAPAPATGSPTP